MKLRAALLAPVLLLTLTACVPIVALHPADDAANPACASVVVALPDTVGGLESRETDAQGTGAWGDPTGVILHCGVPAPGPTTASLCVAVDGIDWIRDDSGDPNFVFTTYGRTPAVEVVVDSDGDPEVDDDGVSGLEALTDLSNAVSIIPQVGKCVALQDAGN